MKRSFEVKRILEKYPSLMELDLHYFGLKSYGIDYENPALGRPKLHILDDISLFSVVPLLIDVDSPYVLRGKKLRFKGEELPFRVKCFKRSNDPYYSYFYFRSKEKWIQTLDSEVSLNLNFNPNCGGCSFCNRVGKSGLENLSASEGMKKLKDYGVNLAEIDELAIVTGMFKNEKDAIDHIAKISEIASLQGFSKKLFYIGSQIKTVVGIRSLFSSVNKDSFRYAYTLESFTNRSFNHKKQESLVDAVNNISILRSEGLDNLEYTYIPGIDPLPKFIEIAPLLVHLAKPHTSIFRPATESQRILPCEEFKENPIEYLCKMRLFFEELYGGPILGNNLANLWPFPLNRLDPKFLSDETNDVYNHSKR